MRIIVKLISLFTLVMGPAAAAPVVNAIVNAASYALPGMPNSGIAQGSMFVVFGTDLGPAELQQASSFPLPTTLAGTSIRVTVGATTVDAILVYAWATQVAAILPSTTPTGIGLLAVTYQGRTSQSGAFRVLRSAPGVLAQNQAGSGPALAQNFNSAADQPRNTLTRAARPGQVVTLWATGLGPIAGSDAVVPAPQDLDLNLQVLVGGKPATVRYKGRSGCCAGVDQIVFEVPRDVEGCYVPVVVRVGDAISNFTTLAVASTGGGCSDFNGISGSGLEKLQSGGDISYGSITLSLSTNFDDDSGDPISYSEGGWASFFRSNRLGFTFAQVPMGLPSLGSCLVYTAGGGSSGPGTPPRSVPLNAGPVLNVSGPKGRKQLSLQGPGNYFTQFTQGASQALYFEPGTYVVDNGSGGTDVGPFRAILTVPRPFTPTAGPTAASVTWQGGDPAGYVIIEGFVPPLARGGVSAGYMCTERVSAGGFTVPSIVLQSLPPNLTDPTGVSISARHVPRSRFQATGLDVGQLSFQP